MDVQLEGPRIALVDLDGTLADFDGGMKAGLEALQSPVERTAGYTAYDDSLPFMKHRKRLIKSQPGFWRDLRPLRLGFEVYEMMEKLGFEIHVLTKGPETTVSAWSEKVEWCQRYVPGAHITITQDKSLVYGRVLVDDWPKYVGPWLEKRPRGLVVMPAQPHNAGFEHERVIRYDGSNPAEVYGRLKAAYARSGGRP